MFWVKEDVLTLTFRLLYLPYKCHVLFDRGHPITIICIIFIFLFFVFVLFLWFILILYIFIVFLIWRGMCVCVCVHAHVWGERKTQIQVGLLEVFLNLCPSTFLLGHKQEAPDAGQRDCFSLSHPLTSGRHHSALPTPGHTQARLGGSDRTGDCSGHLACPLSPQIPLVFVQGRALHKHCLSFCDSWAFIPHPLNPSKGWTGPIVRSLLFVF